MTQNNKKVAASMSSYNDLTVGKFLITCNTINLKVILGCIMNNLGTKPLRLIPWML